MSKLLKEIKTFEDLTNRVDLFCNYAFDYYKYPNIDKTEAPLIAEEILRLYIQELKYIFSTLKSLADFAHNFFHSIENPCYVMHPDLVACNIQIQLDDRKEFYKKNNLRINENPILPYGSAEFFRTALEQTVIALRNLHEQNYKDAIDKIRKESKVSDLVEVENEIKFSFIENRKEITESWCFLFNGLKQQIDYITKKQAITTNDFPKNIITGFNTNLDIDQLETLYKALSKNYIECSLDDFKAIFTEHPKPIKWIDKGGTRHEPNKQTIFEFFYLLKENNYLKNPGIDLDLTGTNPNNFYKKLKFIFPNIKNFPNSNKFKAEQNTPRKKELKIIIQSL